MNELNLFNQETETREPVKTANYKQETVTRLKNTIHNFWNDPGHGWLEVNYSDLLMLGIEKKISGFSYRDGATAYLEEDCDMSLYIETLYADDPIKANMQNWCNTMLRDCYKEHIFIRSLRHY